MLISFINLHPLPKLLIFLPMPYFSCCPRKNPQNMIRMVSGKLGDSPLVVHDKNQQMNPTE